MFEQATHINEYRAAVEAEGDPAFFKFYDKGDYFVGNYISVMAKFPSLIEEGLTAEQLRNRILLRDMRGIIFDRNGRVISKPLHKFHNLNEGLDNQHDVLDWSEFEVYDKLDGCCDAHTLLTTTKGQMTIKEICDSEYVGEVLGFDHETASDVWTLVEAHQIKANNNDWYLVTLEDGNTIKLTGNHKVWVTNKHQYVQVRDLDINDDVHINQIMT